MNRISGLEQKKMEENDQQRQVEHLVGIFSVHEYVHKSNQTKTQHVIFFEQKCIHRHTHTPYVSHKFYEN